MPTPIELDPETLRIIETRFHALIRERAGTLIEQHKVILPTVSAVVVDYEDPRERTWFPVPGMHGGFSYGLVLENGQVKLIAESWSRVVGGSGQRHEITVDGTTLVEEGFV